MTIFKGDVLTSFEEKKQNKFADHVYKELESFFNEKNKSEKKYSLRNCAKHLEMDPTFLSRILSKKNKLTYKTSLRIAKKLEIPINKIHQDLGVQKNLPNEIFNPISHWYFFAIIELRHKPSFKLDPRWIAKQLPISIKQAKEAVRVLETQNHIRFENGEWVFNMDSARWEGVEMSSEAKTNFQKEIVTLANNALDKISTQDRHTYGLTVAASPDVLPQIRLKIRNLAEEIAELCLKSKKTEVFQFQSHFFPLKKGLKS